MAPQAPQAPKRLTRELPLLDRLQEMHERSFLCSVPKQADSDWQTVTSDAMGADTSAAIRHDTVDKPNSMAHISNISTCGIRTTTKDDVQTPHLERELVDTSYGEFMYTQPQTKPLSVSNHKRTPALQFMPQNMMSAFRTVSSSIDGLGHKLSMGNEGQKRRSFESLRSEISLVCVQPRQSQQHETLHNHNYLVESGGELAPGSIEKSCLPPQSNSFADIPKLPFPLISLPQAARLQHLRRERGEEDHTDHGSSFMSRVASTSISTISSSTSPRTPPWDNPEDAFGKRTSGLTPAGAVHYLHQTQPQSPCK